MRPGVDTSVDAADVGVCATTSGTEAQRCGSERTATSALVARVPRLPCRYSYRHLFPRCLDASTHVGLHVSLTSLAPILIFPSCTTFATGC